MRGRRLLLFPAFVAVLATVAGSTVAVAQEESRHGVIGRFDRPFDGFAPSWTKLHDIKPEWIGLDPAPINDGLAKIAAWTTPDPASKHPLFSGAVALIAHDGFVVSKSAVGQAVRYADAAGTELPKDQQVPMRMDTIFDMASVTKLFTSIVIQQLIERQQIDLTAPVIRYLPEFGTNGKDVITVRQLLTHTSGLQADPIPSLWAGYPDIPSRRAAIFTETPIHPPGTFYLYSDINLIVLQFIAEKLTGKPIDQLVREGITEPLGLVDTGFNPPASKLDRIAATEFEANPPRGMVRGSVHDENAWSLGGVAGHAGIFSTAGDLAILAQAILNGGTYNGHRIMKPETVTQMLSNYNQAFPGHDHGLGFELNQIFYMGGLSGPRTAGHTGFTGTDLVIDPASRSFTILLTNRVHPSRGWGSINIARETVATSLARALAVKPQHGRDAWFTSIGNLSTATLTTPLLHSAGPIRVNFATFVDSEDTDVLVLESSTDGTTWQPTTLTATGPGAPPGPAQTLSGNGHRSWWTVRAEVPQAADITFRWRFTTDRLYTGRGVFVDSILVTDGNRTLLNGEKEPHMLHSQEWQLKTR